MRQTRAMQRWIGLLLVSVSCAAGAADASKVLRIAMAYGETGFDPARAGDVNSVVVLAGIMEPLLSFDYLARPVRLVPLTAAALPDIADGGKTYTFKIQQGITFASDPAFGGRKRELTAHDYVYAIKRVVDPALRSPNAFHIAGKIVGLDELAAAAARRGTKFDYEAPVAGLQALDRFTLRIRLKRADSTFAYVMAHSATSAVAREVIEAYAGDVESHPVGTGPYKLKSWTRAAKIVLEANPEFRGVVWNFTPDGDAGDAAIAEVMRGKRMPQVGIVEFRVFHDPQTIWLAFLDGQVDLATLPDALTPLALHEGALAPHLASRGIRLSRFLEPAITYTAFNMRDPVVGGFAKEKIALRRAIAMAYDNQEEIKVLRKGNAIELSMLVPPGIAGYSRDYGSNVAHGPVLANRLLDEMGFRRGADGFRMLPDGKPLAIRYSTQRDANAREFGELWKKAFDSIGVRLLIEQGYFPDQIKAAQACRYQMWSYGWFADYPDGDNFAQLLAGSSVHQSNVACYASPVYDALYAQSREMSDSPQRTRLYERMARQMETDAPWRLHVASYRNALAQPRVIGYKAHPFLQATYVYADVDDASRR
jgi:peptide/nickel transport system substrate-binding protein